MKVTTTILAIALTFSQLIGQKLNPTFNYKSIDTLTVFEPIGNISKTDNYQITPDKFLTMDYLSKFKESMKTKGVAPFQVEFVDSHHLSDLSNQKYFADVMERVQKVNDNAFPSIKIGDKLKEVLESHSGRFFGFIFYSGFEKGESSADAGNSQNTNGSENLYLPLATEKPFVKNYLMIVDKKTSKIIYFHQNKMASSPADITVIEKQVRELLGAM